MKHLSHVLNAAIIGMAAPTSSLVSDASYFDDLADVGSLDLADAGGYSRRRMPQRGGRGMGRQVNARTLIPQIPGVPANGVRLQPLGLGATAFTASSGNPLSLTAAPQRPFKGQRLIVDITRTGTSATGLVTITRLDIGTANQLVSSGALSAAAFAPTAFDANIMLDPATPGITITLQLSISALPTGSDRVDVGGTIFGTSVG